MPFEELQYGNVYELLNTALTSLIGTGYALPPAANVITWHNFSTGGASASSVVIQGSLDGVTWITMDTSTQTAGEMRTVNFNAVRFIRAVVNSRTGGTVNKVNVTIGK